MKREKKMKITTEQRDRGRFYTPEHLVEVANRMIAEQLGDDWRKDYVVWDNSCGTKALTRGYYFNELYCSTIDQWELNASKEYNTEATSFQFDFLNDPLDKLPNGLLEAFEQDKPILFYMNPPYGRAGNNDERTGFSGISAGKTNTAVREEMKTNKMGSGTRNLYAQFIYRIMMIKRKYNLTRCHIAMFGMPILFTGRTWKRMREEMFKDFAYDGGFMFRADQFAGLSREWALNFTVWSPGTTVNGEFGHHVLDIEGRDTGYIKSLYNLDNYKGLTLMDWFREPVKGIKTKPGPSLTSAIKVSQSNAKRYAGRQPDTGSIGYLHAKANYPGGNARDTALLSAHSKNNNGGFICGGYLYATKNHPEGNARDTALLSAHAKDNHGGFICIPDNFLRCTCTFAAHKLVKSNWLIFKDNYYAPDITKPEFNQFAADSVVYSLFNTSSNQSSLRNITYLGQQYDILNQFFWMKKQEVNYTGDEDERYVALWLDLYHDLLSQEAKDVLEAANNMVQATMPYREEFNRNYPEYQINNWDASYYQVKAVAKEYCPDTLQELKKAYDRLSCKMLPLVYELGFLKKEDMIYNTDINPEITKINNKKK